MKRSALTLVVIALLMPAAFAQIVCNQTTHIDQNGNTCTVLVTNGSRYDYGTGDTTYPETSEDGQPFPPDFNASIFVEYYADAGLAVDPLLIKGGPLQNQYCVLYGGDYCATPLSSQGLQGVFGSSTVYTVPTPTTIGAVMGRTTWTVGNLTSQEPGYPYDWSGTFVQVYRCTRIYRGRCNFVAAEGLATLEAIHQ